MSMKPTMDLRWFDKEVESVTLESIYQGDPLITPYLCKLRVLQQKWVDEFDGRIEEWRDIPLVNEGD